MGMKLCNINIYNPNKEELKLKKGYTSVSIVPDWDTIIEEESNSDFNGILNQARVLSRDTRMPTVLSYYFDDDYYELSLIFNGKTQAYYRNSTFEVNSKKPVEFIELLKLGKAETKVWKYVMKTVMPPMEAVNLLSAISQLPLFVDKQIYDDNKLYDNKCKSNLVPDKEQAISNFETLMKTIKLKQGKPKTAEVLCEFEGIYTTWEYNDTKEGDPNRVADKENGIIRILGPDESGKVSYSNIRCFRVQDDSGIPKLQEIYKYNLPFNKIATEDYGRYLGVMPGYQRDEGEIYQLMYGDAYCLGQVPVRDLPEIAEMRKIPKTAVRPFEYIQNTEYKTVNLWNDSSLRYVYNSWEVAEIGTNMVTLKDSQGEVSVKFYDNFQLTRSLDIPTDKMFHLSKLKGKYYWIEEKDEIILDGYVINLKDRTLTRSDTLPSNFEYIWKRTLSTGGTELYIVSGNCVYTFDLDYNLIESCKFKGKCIVFFADKKDRLYMVTSSRIFGAVLEYKDSDRIRLLKVK